MNFSFENIYLMMWMILNIKDCTMTSSFEFVEKHSLFIDNMDIFPMQKTERKKRETIGAKMYPEDEVQNKDDFKIDDASSISYETETDYGQKEDSRKATEKANTNPNYSDNEIGSRGASNTHFEKLPSLENVEYDDKSSGTLLDVFDTTAKLHGSEGALLPVFLHEPESAFVVKNRPAKLKCKASHALRIQFKCSGSSQPPPTTHDKHVNPHTGVYLEEAIATISRDLVDEYFGKGPFKCECQAFSSRGVIRSQPAVINVAYIRKQFLTPPTSLRVEIGSRAELHCEAPNAIPTPKITWYKNGILIPFTNNNSITISPTNPGDLVFGSVSLQDVANYTCAAENIAGKRLSDSAVLIVYVNGGWSPWTSWSDCTCNNRLSSGRKRMRYCNNPLPTNGGSPCSGPHIQKSIDCVTCQGQWSPWSEWSSCSSSCIQFRRRKCILDDHDGNRIGENLLNFKGESHNLCPGKDIQTADCRGGTCNIVNDDFDWTFVLSLSFVAFICVVVGGAFILFGKRNMNPHPRCNVARSESSHGKRIEKKNICSYAEQHRYDYANLQQADNTDDYIVNYAVTEHHYDVPILSVNYTNPHDETNMDYFTDTPETSTYSSNSANDMPSKASSDKVQWDQRSTILNARQGLCSNNGGCMRLYNGQLMLYVPYLAIAKKQKMRVMLSVMDDDAAHISFPPSESLLIGSPIVNCGPSDHSFLKPIIIKIPHCLTNCDQWKVSIFRFERHPEDITGGWTKMSTLGEETINTPIFAHIDSTHAYLMTEKLGRFAIIADSKPDVGVEVSIRMQLFVYNQITPNNCILRVYVARSFPTSVDICSKIEFQLGGTYLGQSPVFKFYLNNKNVKIRLNGMNNTTTNQFAPISEMQEQVIPYNHIVKCNSVLHCEFSTKRTTESMSAGFYVEFAQSEGKDTQDIISFTIPNMKKAKVDESRGRISDVFVDDKGNSTNEINNLALLQLNPLTKSRICEALDIPRIDENDWRLLATKLNTDRYIAYFATKPSPTEQILNLMECQVDNSSNTLVKLLNILKEMNRHDVIDLLEMSVSHNWV